MQVYVPQRAMTDDRPLVAILGRMLAEQLQESHANLILEIPRCAACGSVTLERAKQIRKGMA